MVVVVRRGKTTPVATKEVAAVAIFQILFDLTTFSAIHTRLFLLFFFLVFVVKK